MRRPRASSTSSSGPSSASLTCEGWADDYLARYEEAHKASSTDTARAALRRFRADFGDRPLDGIERIEAMRWADRAPNGVVAVVVTMFNAAVDAELIDRNPFRGQGHKSKGRAEQRPPTEEELSRLLAACAVHKWYAPQMRALIIFASYSGMRPGEIFTLEWSDVDLDAMRIDVRRRVYKGEVDTPKSNKPRRIALTPPARVALLGQPTRHDGGLVFRSKQGKRLTQPTLSGYWGKVTARAGLDFNFYLATKHYAVHYLYATLGLPPRVIAEQMGWGLAGVLKQLAVYGHGDIGALEEIDRAFNAKVAPLRAVDSDASRTQEGA